MRTNWKLSVVALSLLVAGTASVNAQNWRNAPKEHFGVRAGIASTDVLGDIWDGAGDSKPLTAPTVGIAYDIKVAKLPFYVETGLYYMNRGQKYEGTYHYDQHYSTYKETVDNHSLLVPALISYHAYVKKDMSFQPFMGPYLAYGFKDEEVDYGWRMGCGFNAKQFYVNVGFDIGLKDDFDTHPGEVSSLFMTVGWNFLGKK